VNGYAERRCAIFGRKQVCVQPYEPMGTAPRRAPNCAADAVNVELASGAGMFLACGTNVQCDSDTRLCVSRCLNDRDCGGAYPVCNRDSGECECSTDADCGEGTSAVVGHPVCIDGDCGCSMDSHCDAFPNGDVCVDGTCGCSGADACDEARTHDGTSYVCVEPDEA